MPTMTRAGYRPPKAPRGAGPAKAPKGRKKKKKRGANAVTAASLAVFALAVCIGALTLIIYAQTQPYRDAFAPGTSLGGSPLAGLDAQQGALLLHEQTDEAVAAWRYKWSYAGTTYGLSAQDVGLAVDVNATLDPLWQRGKGNMLSAWLDLLALRRRPQQAQVQVTYDLAPAQELLRLMKADIDRDATDATVSFVPGSSAPFRFMAEQTGLRLDTQALLGDVERSLQSLTPGEAALAPQELAPAVYEAALREATVLRGRATVTFAPDEAARRNASLAVEAINGAVVAPGETLSFNALAGARTQQAGYVEAVEPAYGPDARGVGGGVCQTATALYQAALLGDVAVAERHAAAYPVAYAQPGLEAAVSDQGLDLALANDTDTPLYVTARLYALDEDAEGGYAIEAQVIGAPLASRFRLESQAEETGTIEEPVYVRDSEGLYATYADERVPVREGMPGVRAQVTRVETDRQGEELSRETVSEDEYAPIAPAVYVGVSARE